MNRQSQRMLNQLERELSQLYQRAATTAAQRHEESIRRLQNFQLAAEEGGRFAHLSEAEKAHAMRNYVMQAERMGAIVMDLREEIGRTGEIAADMIRERKVDIHRQEYIITVEDLMRQVRQNPLPQVDWSLYEREQLRLILYEQPESFFTKVAYDNLGLTRGRPRIDAERRLRNQLAESILLRDNMNQITKRVQGVTHSEFYRARRIARTESLRAANMGRAAAAQQGIDEYGILATKVWVATIDARVRDDHLSMHYVEADPEGFFHLPNGDTAKYPLDISLSAENTVHCRCTHIYRIPTKTQSEAFQKLLESMERSKTQLLVSAAAKQATPNGADLERRETR